MDRETRRLAALKSYQVLDTPADPALDRLTALAGNLFGVPIALVSLVDEQRQWFKARVGLDAESTGRDLAFCAHAIEMGPNAVMVVEDATRDPRFADNPLVTGRPDIRFYAGATLTTKDGDNLGTLCVIDDKPRPRPSEAELERLKLLAGVVVDEFELTKAHRQAREKQRLLEIAESMAKVGHWRYDLDTREISWSDAIFEIYGLSRETFDPQIDDAIAYYHPEDRQQVRDCLQKGADTHSGFEFQLRLYRPDGALRHVASKAVCELGEGGRPVALIGLLQDVTDQVSALKAAENSAARYRLLTDNANDLVTKMDREGRFTYVSPAVKAVTGYLAQEVVGRRAIEFIHPDDHARVQAAFADLPTGPSAWRIEYRILCKDGSMRWMEARPTLARDPQTGEMSAVTDVIRDITAHKAAEIALADSEARYRLLADNASDMIAEFTPGGEILFISPGCRKILGFTPEEMVGRKVYDILHPDDREVMSGYYAVRVPQGPGVASEPFHVRGRHKDGRWVWLEGQPTLFFDADGRLTGIQDTVRDITSRKALEADLQQARAEAEAAAGVKAEFVSNMSHELRTPLTAVLGFSRMIAAQPELSPATRAYVGKTVAAGEALLATVNDILDFSKLEAGQVEIERAPCDARTLLGDALALFSLQAGAKGVALVADGLDALPPSLMLAPDRVRQVLLNLLGNAVKFTDAGAVELAAVHADGRLTVSVSDTGPGMPAERLGELFKRFSQIDGSSTRRHGGTGLGLAICKGLIEAMGGEIGVDSQLGQGARFWFSLPAEVAETAEAVTDVGQVLDLPAGCRVLVVDDNMVNRELVGAVLGGFDVDLSEAADG
ncbi:PAS domain S-box protein [Caulobacter hibisci]|uniref:histidine kinase n=1 Tax=Caulobacter hibisci TaxID=2035993 RepID=A0ABS0STP0_9CAUL|nr:PAS domain S-box protein [Caulobacter hibisci]MBI1682591.1 PAS domain S-box protein [Caulobacter hibisci]